MARSMFGLSIYVVGILNPPDAARVSTRAEVSHRASARGRPWSLFIGELNDGRSP